VGKPARPDLALLVKTAVREALAEAMPQVRAAIRDEVRSVFAASGMGPRDSADCALVGAIASQTVRMPCFFVGDLWALRGSSNSLREALQDADIETPNDLGTFLGRVADVEIDGFVVRRHGPRVGRGQPWQCRKCA
jgi:hypothetical protein